MNQSKSKRLEGLHLIVADDNPIFQQLISELLTNEGAKVTAVGSLQGVQAILESFQPHLLVCDERLPDGRCSVFVEEFRHSAHKHAKTLKVVGLSGEVLSSLERQQRLTNFQGYLTKPVDIEVLIESVQAATQV